MTGAGTNDKVGISDQEQMEMLEIILWKSLIHKHRDKIIKDKKKLSLGKRMLRHFYKFCSSTSLHGLHYLSDENRLLIEKLWWMVTLALVYLACFLLIKDATWNFLHNPAEITIENMPTPVGLLPFPAITICGSNQIKSTVFNFSAYFSMTTEEKASLNRTFLHKLDYTDMFCRLGQLPVGQDKLDISVFHFMLNHAHNNLRGNLCRSKMEQLHAGKTMRIHAADFDGSRDYATVSTYYHTKCYCPKLISKCWVRLHTTVPNWSKISKVNWTPESGYNGAPPKAFDIPFRTCGSGSIHALTMSLDTRSEDNTGQCNLGSSGYTILMHSPTQIPSSSNARSGVSGNSYHSVTVVPRKLRTSTDIGLWPPEKRGCYYYDERELLFFKVYTQVNCDLECESNYSLKTCGCVAYYHPRTLFTPVCGSNKMDCIEDSLTRFAEIYTENQGECGCLPTCTQFDYESDVMSMDVAARLRFKKKKNKAEEKKGEQYSIISFTYQNRDTLGFLRDGRYGITDFLGNLGGIAGLFLGFSWISLLEIAYFTVLRPLANARMRYLARR